MHKMKLNYLGARYNDLSDVMLDTISSQILQLFRAKTPILSRINTDISGGEEAVGETIKARLPIDLGDADVLAPDAESVATDYTQQTAPVTMSWHIYKEFTMGIREFSTAMANGTVPLAFDSAIDSVSRFVNQKVLGLASAVVDTAGGAGSKYGLNSVIAAKAELDKKQVEAANRFLGLGSLATNDLLKHTINSGYDKNDPHYKTGDLGDMLGFNVFSDTKIVSPDGLAPEPNIAYHRSAFTAAFRRLEGADSNTSGAIVQQITDPLNGLPMRLTIWFNPKTSKHHWRVETLFGCASTRPSSAVIMLQDD